MARPVRAKLVAHLRDHHWSRYRAHAPGEADALVSDHAMSKGPGRSAPDPSPILKSKIAAPLRPTASSYPARNSFITYNHVVRLGLEFAVGARS